MGKILQFRKVKKVEEIPDKEPSLEETKALNDEKLLKAKKDRFKRNRKVLHDCKLK